MTLFLQFLASGLAQGFVIALLASGFVVIHRVTNVVSMTQGTSAVIGGFLCYSLLGMGLPHGAAEVGAVLGCALLGAGIGYVAIGRRTSALTALIVTFGLAVLFYGVEILIWGDQPVSYTGWEGATAFGGVTIQNQYILIAAVSILTLAGLELFFDRTYAGKALTACHMNPYAARILGIDPTKMGLLAFALGSALGGLAGILVAPLQSVSYDADIHLALNGFAAAVVGGLLHPRMAMLGGLVLGVVGKLVAGYFSAAHELEVSLALMLLAMVWHMRRRTLEAA